MKNDKFEAVVLIEELNSKGFEVYEKICCYLIQKYYEDCEEYEGLGLLESFYRGTGRERLFDTSSKK